MYGARTMRGDPPQPLTILAQDITKWNRNCDVRMHKLFCYATQTFDHSMDAVCGDHCQNLRLMVYCDASFADCVRTHKSRSGAYIALVGYNAFLSPCCYLSETDGSESLLYGGRDRSDGDCFQD